MQAHRIPLRTAAGTTAALVLVDVEDYAKFTTWRWQLSNGYASRTCKKRGKVYLHREIMGMTKGNGLMVDHINRDRLDCRRENLRIVTATGNTQNRGPWKRGRTGIRGVSWHEGTGKWRVHVNGKHHGLFVDIEEAARHASEVRARLLPLSHEPN